MYLYNDIAKKATRRTWRPKLGFVRLGENFIKVDRLEKTRSLELHGIRLRTYPTTDLALQQTSDEFFRGLRDSQRFPLGKSQWFV